MTLCRVYGGEGEMMISPEAYYEIALRGKSQSEILEEINELQEEISRLKQVIEKYGKKAEAGIFPDPLTRLKCNREYLERAKRALEEAGGHYEPTEEERRDQSFNKALVSMHRFILKISGFFSGWTKYTYTINEESVAVDAEHGFDYELSEPSVYDVYKPFTREEFVRGIADLHIGEWEQSYDDPGVLDGTQWGIRIEYEDGREPVEIDGSNAYPYNYRELLKFLEIDN